ncbi:MAG: hypothetical protein ACREGR_01755, partial [Minisyncoccia bacterium]
SQEFCTGCGKTKKCQAIVETSGHIDCWCEDCWMDFLGLAYKARDEAQQVKRENDATLHLPH